MWVKQLVTEALARVRVGTSGLVNAICLHVVILQCPSLLGVSSDSNADHAQWQNIVDLFQKLGDTKIPILIVSTITFAFLFGVTYLQSKRPDNVWMKFFPT